MPQTSSHYGRLVEDRDEGRVQCGLCGRWYRALPSHLRHAHDTDADQYRLMFGLRSQRALVASDVSLAMRAALRRRLADRERLLLDGIAEGHGLARSGELPRLGLAAVGELPLVGERLESRRSGGRTLGRRRAELALAVREARARELSGASLEQHLTRRYALDGARVADIAAELGVAEITVVADMERFGIARRSQEERLALGRDALARGRRARRAGYDARARELGFEDLRDYLIDRLQRRWRQCDVAKELGAPLGRVRELVRECGLRPARAAAPIGARDPGIQRLAAASRALAAKRRARDDAIARRLGFPDIAAWYAARRVAGVTAQQLIAEAGMGEKWLRRLARQWREQRLPGTGETSEPQPG